MSYDNSMAEEKIDDGFDTGEERLEDDLEDDEEVSAEPLDNPVSKPAFFPEVQDDDEALIEAQVLSKEQREARRLARKPAIDHLNPGTVVVENDVLPLFNIGDRIVAERHAPFLKGNPWLDTRIYRVKAIDDDTGVVTCHDEEFDHHAYIGFKHDHTRIMMCPARGNPFKRRERMLVKDDSVNVTRGPRPGPQINQERNVDASTGEVIKKGRGRPKGSKNRPREEILAEKRARKEEKMAKRAAREARKNMR